MPPFSPDDHNHLPRHGNDNGGSSSSSTGNNHGDDGSASAVFGVPSVKAAEEGNGFGFLRDIVIDEEELALGVSDLVGKWFETDTETETDTARHDSMHDARHDQRHDSKNHHHHHHHRARHEDEDETEDARHDCCRGGGEHHHHHHHHQHHHNHHHHHHHHHHQQQQHKQQQQQPHHPGGSFKIVAASPSSPGPVEEEQPRRRRRRSTSKSSIRAGLPTIPERRVTFAAAAAFFGNHQYMAASVDAIELIPIPHVSEYTARDKRRMWYTRSDISGMRKSCVGAALRVAKDTELYCPVTFRGLEYLIDAAIEIELAEVREINSDSDSDNDSDSETNSDSDSHIDNYEPLPTSESRRWDALEAVLDEQDRQQRFGEADPGAIRSVYEESGRTEAALSVARLYALRDEACAREWRDEDAANKREPQAYGNGSDVGDGDETAGGTRCYSHRTSDGLPSGIEHVLRMLLAPFLDLRCGDLYRVMGEECL